MRKALIPILTALTALTALAVAVGTAGGSTTAAQSPTTSDRTLITCGRTRTIGVAAPITGAAASIGSQQGKWARYWVTRYNRSHRRTKFRTVVGDTQLPDTAQAIQVAERLASNSQVLGVVGPAGSQEVQVSTAPFKNGGLGFVSGSATRTSLTTDGRARGYFFRVVPNDDQQGPRVANYIRGTLRHSRVAIVDAQNSYSTGLSDTVQRILRSRGVNVQRESVNEADTTDFSSLAARIPANTQSVYIPWQLAPKAQLFGQALRTQGKRAVLFGSDGLFDPDSFKIPGSYVSFFPINLTQPDHRRVPAWAWPGQDRAVRPPELPGGRRGRPGDRQGVRQRHGDARRGPAEHQPDEHPAGSVARRLPRPLRPARERRAGPR